MKASSKDLVLESFGLPPTFPLGMMPDAAKQFIADPKKGMPVSDLVALAKVRGFRPLWKALPHMVEENVFGLGLDVGGLQVPLMAKMARVAEAPLAAPAPAVDPRQQSLF